jgi:hypothetical protein
VADSSHRGRLRSFAGSTHLRHPTRRLPPKQRGPSVSRTWSRVTTKLVTRPAGFAGVREGADTRVATGQIATLSRNGRMIMANKDSQKGNVKKVGKSLKEKRAAKKAKVADKTISHIPPTNR